MRLHSLLLASFPNLMVYLVTSAFASDATVTGDKYPPIVIKQPTTVKFFPEDTVESERIPDEQKLLNYIMRGYEKSVRPVLNASNAVLVKMGLTLTQIFDLDEKNQVLITNVWLDQEWDDEFLTWNPADFNNITTIRIPCTKIWLPDIVLYNNAAEYTDGTMPANAMVSNTGNVFWPVPTKLHSSCKVDVTYFPFDTQECYLKFGSWTYDGFQVDIDIRSTEVDLSNYVKNGEWHLLGVKVKRKVVVYSCCIEPFPDVRFFVSIERRMLYYMYNVVFPCILMSALTLLVFCLPPDSGEKIALGITVLLAFSVFMLAIAENLPETSEFVPLISIYLTVVMALTSMSVTMTVFVLNLHHRGPNKNAVPPWLSHLLLGKVARFLCLGTDNRELKHQTNMDSNQFLQKLSMKLALEKSERVDLRVDMDNGAMAERIPDTSSNHVRFTNGSRDHCVTIPNDHTIVQNDSNHVVQNSTNTNHANTQKSTTHKPRANSRKRQNYNEEILRALRKLTERHDREDREFSVTREWRRVAQVVDRILFWIFLFTTTVASISVLVVLPLSR